MRRGDRRVGLHGVRNDQRGTVEEARREENKLGPRQAVSLFWTHNCNKKEMRGAEEEGHRKISVGSTIEASKCRRWKRVVCDGKEGEADLKMARKLLPFLCSIVNVRIKPKSGINITCRYRLTWSSQVCQRET